MSKVNELFGILKLKSLKIHLYVVYSVNFKTKKEGKEPLERK